MTIKFSFIIEFSYNSRFIHIYISEISSTNNTEVTG